MPITPEYKWEEDENVLRLEISLKGVKPASVDAFIADEVIKINFKPYLLLIDLYDQVDDASATAKTKNGILTVTIKKKTPGLWKQLTATGEKKELEKRREMSIQRKMDEQAELSSKRKEKKYQDEKHSLRKQMALEEAERQHLEDLKAEEKEREEKAMYESLKHLSAETTERKHQAIASNTILRPNPKIFECIDEIDEESEEEEIEQSKEDDQDEELTDKGHLHIVDEDAVTMQQDDEQEISYCPEPRKNNAPTKIAFTPRIFPTPMRESKAADEEEWIMKNRKHIASHKALNKYANQDISETDPMWLKGRGDEYYRSRDYRSAINAYTTALEADASFVACYSNRSACYLHLGEFEACMKDCNKALALLPDTMAMNETEENRVKLMKERQQKLRIIVRRGTAYCQMGKYSEAKADYGIAVSMDMHKPALAEDFSRVVILEGCARQKEEADKLFASGDLEAAIQLYTTVLERDSTFISCLSNRAACYLANNQPTQCIEDCTTALRFLEQRAEGEKFVVLSGPIPQVGSQKRRIWVLKTLVRRGTAATMLKDYKQALLDYQDAISLDPKNEELRADMQKIEKLCEGPAARAK